VSSQSALDALRRKCHVGNGLTGKENSRRRPLAPAGCARILLDGVATTGPPR
jgi:hypothetical protein